MTASIQDLQRWFLRGVEIKANHMIVVCDTFSYENYPVYTTGLEEFEKKYKKYNNQNMQTIDEVYDLNLPVSNQFPPSRKRVLLYPIGFDPNEE